LVTNILGWITMVAYHINGTTADSKGNIDVKVNVDLPSEKKPKKQGNKFYF